MTSLLGAELDGLVKGVLLGSTARSCVLSGSRHVERLFDLIGVWEKVDACMMRN